MNYVRGAAEARAAKANTERVEATADQAANAAARGSELRSEQSMENWEERRGRHYREMAQARAAPPCVPREPPGDSGGANSHGEQEGLWGSSRDSRIALRTLV